VHPPSAAHVAAAAAVTASLQAAFAQALPTVGTRQVPLPSHTASLAHAPAPSVLHSLSGSVPLAMGPHVPSVPAPFFAAVQASQVPEHALSQQMPSTQKPLVQSVAVAQALGVQGEAG
jgi:hypothetical protein